ncbi:MAG: hypothetical protein AAF960_23410 [Bacteroidota bacterium]
MSDVTKTATEQPTQKVTKIGFNLSETAQIKDLFESGNLDQIDQLEVEPLNIATQYYDFEQNKPVRFAFLGITEQPTNGGEMLPAVVLLDKEKNTYVNMGTILVNTFVQNQITIGSLVEIKWIGVKKTQRGNSVRTWSIRPLKVKKQ